MGDASDSSAAGRDYAGQGSRSESDRKTENTKETESTKERERERRAALVVAKEAAAAAGQERDILKAKANTAKEQAEKAKVVAHPRTEGE